MADDINLSDLENIQGRLSDLAEQYNKLRESAGEAHDKTVTSLESELNLLLQQKVASGEIKTLAEANATVEAERVKMLQEVLNNSIARQKQLQQELTIWEKRDQQISDTLMKEYQVASDVDQLRKMQGFTLNALNEKEKGIYALLIEQEKGREKELENQNELLAVKTDLNANAKEYAENIRDAKENSDELTASVSNLDSGTSDLAGSILGIFGIKKTKLSDTLGHIFKGTLSIKDAFSSLGQKLKEGITPETVLLATLNKVFQSTYKMVTEANEAFTSMTRTTGVTSEAHEDLVKTTFYGNLEMGQSIGEVAEAYGALHSSLADFSNQTIATQKRLTESAMIYKNLGVSGTSFATALTNVTKSAGLSDSALARITKTANNMGFNTEQAFNMLNENAELFFQYSGPQLEKEFANMSALSKNLGIDMGTLGKAMGQFDTFEGAANSVGRLNAMLRGPYFNTLEMLRATESERVQLLQRGLHESGKSWGTMNRFQKKYIAEQAGLNVVDMGKIMRGEDTMDEMTARNQAFNSTMDDLKKMAIDATPIIKKFTNLMVKFALPFEIIIDILDWLVTALNESEVAFFAFGAAIAFAMAPFNKWAAVAQFVITSIVAIGNAFRKRESPPTWQLPLAMAGGVATFTGIMIKWGGVLKKTTGTIGRFRKGMSKSSKGASSWAKNMFLAGAGIGAAALGLSMLVKAFADMDWNQFGILAAGMGLLALTVAGLALVAKVAAGPIALLGLGLLMIGAGIALAGAGIRLMGQGILLMARGAGELSPLILPLMGLLATAALAGPGLILSAVGLVVFSGAMLMLSAALALIHLKTLSEFTNFMEALSDIDYGSATGFISALTDLTSEIDEVASGDFELVFSALGIDAIAQSLKEIPVEKAHALTSVLEATTRAASVDVDTTSLAKDVERMAMATFLMDVSLDKRAKKDQEGVLVTDKIVVDLGGGKRFEKRVLDIVNKKLGSKI